MNGYNNNPQTVNIQEIQRKDANNKMDKGYNGSQMLDTQEIVKRLKYYAEELLTAEQSSSESKSRHRGVIFGQSSSESESESIHDVIGHRGVIFGRLSSESEDETSDF